MALRTSGDFRGQSRTRIFDAALHRHLFARPNHEHGARGALDENVREIKRWEEATRHARSRTERVSDWIAAKAAGGPVMIGHAVAFTVWIVVNIGLVPWIRPFDPFPFPFLTMAVSLEAIFLALFVISLLVGMFRRSP